MSKAFTREDDRGEPVMIPARPPLPAGVPNYVTARGLQRLRGEWGKLELERATVAGGEGEQTGASGERARKLELLDGRLAALANRIGSALVVDAPAEGRADEEVRFGVTVTVRPVGDGSGARSFTIVGVDEAEAATGRVAFVAPIARALLGRRVGEVVTVRRGGLEEELEILAIAHQD